MLFKTMAIKGLMKQKLFPLNNPKLPYKDMSQYKVLKFSTLCVCVWEGVSVCVCSGCVCECGVCLI